MYFIVGHILIPVQYDLSTALQVDRQTRSRVLDEVDFACPIKIVDFQEWPLELLQIKIEHLLGRLTYRTESNKLKYVYTLFTTAIIFYPRRLFCKSCLILNYLETPSIIELCMTVHEVMSKTIN